MRDRPIPRSRLHAALAGWWSLALLAASQRPDALVHAMPDGLRLGIEIVVGLALAVGLAIVLRPGIADGTRRAVGTAAAVVAPLVALWACHISGVRSVAFVTAGLCVLGTIVALGVRATWIGAAGLVVVATAGLAFRGDGPQLGDITYAVALVTAVTVLPSLYIQRSTERQAERMLAELPSFGVPLTGAAGERTTAVALPRDPESHDARVHAEALAQYLRQVRDTLGAGDAVFWRAPIPGGTLAPYAWASQEARRLREDLQLGRHLVEVLRAEQVALFDRESEGMVAAVVVPGGAGPLGVLTVHEPRAAMRSTVLSSWLPRFSENLGMLAQLLETQAEYSRQTRQASAVLDASQAFQKHRDEASLGQVIADAALRVTGGTRAALVRWHEEQGTGTVVNVTADHYLARGLAIAPDSLVAHLCRTGHPQVWEDARRVEDAAPVYGASRPVMGVESLAVIPFRQGSRTTGAIVVEGDRVGGVVVREVRNLRLLASIAGESLETVRLIEQTKRQADTDALTGLMNRGAFDAALRREIAEADRYGRTVGLIVCDVDHFKRVNDLFGHDAGDEVLKAVATSLVAGVRDVDLVARYGGEELVVLLVQSDLAHTWEVADRLRAAVEARTIPVGDRMLRVTASFGVAAYPETVRLGEELFPAADRALYEAKREGRNCVRFARPLQPPVEEGEGPEGWGDGYGFLQPPEGGPPL